MVKGYACDGKVGERRRERVEGLGEATGKFEVGERGREEIEAGVESISQVKVGERGREPG